MYKEMSSGALAWFQHKAASMIAKGKIPGGRETAQSDLANCFFQRLAGGPEEMHAMRIQLGSNSKANLEELGREYGIGKRESLYYSVYANALWSKKK
jgi:hypothetical protein